MEEKSKFHEYSYDKHSSHFKDYSVGGAKEAHAKTWFEVDTVDSWRHQRMYQVLDPILNEEPDAEWLTVGDGRYGNDAKYILRKGVDALASDISEILLKEAKDSEYLPDYRVENAESLSFADSEFDYVLCKESYHHFPRPMIALYEMLRVARRGVLLIEPNDTFTSNKSIETIIRNAKNWIKLFLNRPINNQHSFEESGNYVYSISRREIEKVALGLNYSMVAFKGINDAYFEGVEYEKLSSNGPLLKKVRKQIKKADMRCKFGLADYGVLSAIIFKTKPSDELLLGLTKGGYEIINLPKNPFIET